ncbi:hypothetical protein DYB32_008686 [Aphanomyces invadans]|uniref:PIPK domain-containing protein n=1 Tax=Aphanomyces invadans TaxID=157072 RepID=A0A3R6ZJP7_9STRA|nr:hypothetical protein DYB32_008686 [Aphanomyces invadans]
MGRLCRPSYHTYLQTHPKSFLCRYFGCHSISLPVGTRRMYFVVMHNLFDEGPVDHRFDLKGNTDRRQAIQSHHVEQYIARSQNREYIAKLMMDIDFLKLRQAVHVDESDEAEMQSQLIQDITFLATQSIMDYSVLLGVKFVRDEHTTTNATDATPDTIKPRHLSFLSIDESPANYELTHLPKPHDKSKTAHPNQDDSGDSDEGDDAGDSPLPSGSKRKRAKRAIAGDLSPVTGATVVVPPTPRIEANVVIVQQPPTTWNWRNNHPTLKFDMHLGLVASSNPCKLLPLDDRGFTLWLMNEDGYTLTS